MLCLKVFSLALSHKLDARSSGPWVGAVATYGRLGGLALAEEAEVDESQKGIYFNMDLTLLYAYVNDWIKLVENNAGEIFGEESPAAEDFKEALPMVREVIGAIGELKGIRSHTRKVNGEMRTSVHFKTGG